MDLYKTVLNETSYEFIEKRSKFIGHIKQVKSEDEAISFINDMKTKYWDAKHNVYAYSINDQNIVRYSDDGEPQGTAGVPVLDVIKKHGLTNVVVVVTRYFGGTLLGTGGLVRAYSTACKGAIENSSIVTMHPCYKAYVKCDYNIYKQVSSLILSNSASVYDTQFLDYICVYFYIKKDSFAKLQKQLSEISSGKLSASICGEEYFAL